MTPPPTINQTNSIQRHQRRFRPGFSARAAAWVLADPEGGHCHRQKQGTVSGVPAYPTTAFRQQWEELNTATGMSRWPANHGMWYFLAVACRGQLFNTRRPGNSRNRPAHALTRSRGTAITAAFSASGLTARRRQQPTRLKRMRWGAHMVPVGLRGKPVRQQPEHRRVGKMAMVPGNTTVATATVTLHSSFGTPRSVASTATAPQMLPAPVSPAGVFIKRQTLSGQGSRR